jgi:hypothetical protein
LSTGHDGLYAGSLWNQNRTFEIDNSQIEKVSFKTLWLSWDVNNYTSNTEFTFLENQKEKRKTRTFNYSATDDDNQKTKIVKYGVNRIESTNLFEENNVEEVDYITNSNSKMFVVYKDGRITTRTFMIGKDAHLSMREHTIQEKSRIGKILDAKIANESVVLETMKNLYLLQESGLQKLSQKAPFSFRSFLTSRRYRKNITASYGNYSELYTTTAK